MTLLAGEVELVDPSAVDGVETGEVGPFRVSRRKFEDCLRGMADFLRVTDISKAPTSSFSEGRRNCMKHIPFNGNYGVKPRGNLFVLDIDLHNPNAASIEDQISYFGRLFEVDLRSTMATVTQTGGLHIFLKADDSIKLSDFEFPKNSLRYHNSVYNKIVGENLVIDADIRSGLSNGYVVGPGSYFPTFGNGFYDLAGGRYGFNKEYEIATVPESAIKRLSDALKEDKWRLRKKNAGNSGDNSNVGTASSGIVDYSVIPSGFDAVSDDDVKVVGFPSQAVLSLIKRRVDAKKIASYHAKRAYVKSALHCCYSDDVIAAVCVNLGYDRDTFSDSRISEEALHSDIEGFTPQAKYHSSFCPNSKAAKRKARQSASGGSYEHYNLDEVIAKNKYLVENRAFNKSGFHTVMPTVLDIGRISKAILLEKKRANPGVQYFNAMGVVNYFLQPLSNVGATSVILAVDAVSERLGISRSQASQALRLLRSSGVIRIVRRQRTGLAALYSVDAGFVDNAFTRSLRNTWGARYRNIGGSYLDVEPLVFDYSGRCFRTVFTDEEVSIMGDYSRFFDGFRAALPDVNFTDFGSGAARSYLLSSAKHFGYEVVDGDDVIIADTGELVSKGKRAEKPKRSRKKNVVKKVSVGASALGLAAMSLIGLSACKYTTVEGVMPGVSATVESSVGGIDIPGMVSMSDSVSSGYSEGVSPLLPTTGYDFGGVASYKNIKSSSGSVVSSGSLSVVGVSRVAAADANDVTASSLVASDSNDTEANVVAEVVLNSGVSDAGLVTGVPAVDVSGIEVDGLDDLVGELACFDDLPLSIGSDFTVDRFAVELADSDYWFGVGGLVDDEDWF